MVGDIQRIALLFHNHNDLNLKCQPWVLLVEHEQSDQLRHRVPRNPIARVRDDERTVADLAIDFIPDAVLSDYDRRNEWNSHTIVRVGERWLICHHYSDA